VLVNIHQTNPPSGDFTNLYQLHGWEIDYPANGAPTISRLQDPTLGTGILLDGIRVDETVIDQIRGGRVPPFVIETKVGGASQLGGLLISHETFIHTFPRSPGEALGIGNVVVHWLQWDNASQPYDLHQVASKSFYSTPQVDRQRRSNLATYYSTNSNDHNYGFAWQTINLDRTDYQGHLAKISLNYQLLSLSFTDRNYPNPPPHQKKDARSLYGPNLDELLLVDASVLGAGTHPAFRIFWWDPVTTLETEIPPGCPSGGSPCAEFPRRPGYATQSGFDLAIVYDAQFGPNSPRRPFLHIVDL